MNTHGPFSTAGGCSGRLFLLFLEPQPTTGLLLVACPITLSLSLSQLADNNGETHFHCCEPHRRTTQPYMTHPATAAIQQSKEINTQPLPIRPYDPSKKPSKNNQASNLPIIPPPPIQTNTQTQKETPSENPKQPILVPQPLPIYKTHKPLIPKPQITATKPYNEP